ncbi:YDG domain-containing protein, partial [Mitsuokella sp.]|uniref:YDG domain-containing protein n=1 Tax=Mitsuokella sp. TaxID=2049034 RepID=UPI003D7D28CB
MRAFLRANANGGTVTVNYDYNMGKDPDGTAVTGSNGGSNLKKPYNANDLTLSNITFTGSNGGVIDSSKISTDSTTLHDANVYTDGTTTSNGVDYFYTGQDGYDLVGNHINIEQREVDLTNSIDTSRVMRKAYDGTKAVDAKAVASLFAAGKSDGKGLILGDNTASFNTLNLKGTFDTATVGQGKTVTLSGGVTLENAAGHNNYKISQGSTTFDGQTLSGIITPRVLTVKPKKSYEKVYNAKANTKTTPVAEDFQPFGDDIVSGEKVELSLTNPSGTYGDGTGTAFKENANAGSRTVKLSGLSLSGDNAANYILEDSEKNILFSSKYDADARDVGGINSTSGGALFTTGTITKRDILNTGFSWYKDGVKQTAAREYDGTSAYADPVQHEVRSDTSASTGDTGMIKGDQLTFTVKAAKFVADAAKADSTEAKDAHAAQGVAYTVTVSGAAAANYTLGGADITAGQTNTVVGEGSITPRTIKLVANAAKTASKVYDGDAVVKDSIDATKGTDSNPFTLSDGYLAYADAADKSHHLVDGDGSTLTYTGVYEKTGSETAAKDVNYANGVVQNKNITYTALVKDSSGNASANYVF